MSRSTILMLTGVLLVSGCASATTSSSAPTPQIIYVTPNPTLTPPPTVAPTDAPLPTDTPAPTVSSDCVAAMTPLVSGLEDLDSRLSVGLNFAAYSTAVADLRVLYDRIKVANLDPDCVSLVGVPAENALNDYTAAYTIWNKCVSSFSCTNASIDTKLQAQWSKATAIITALRATMP